MRTLVTGFGPFPGIADNPSARLARHLAAHEAHRPHEAMGDELTVRVLPVSFGWTKIILPQLLLAGRYDAALLLGVDSGGRESVRLERYGRNRTRGSSVDVDGRAPGDAPIQPAAPDLYKTQVDVDDMLARMTERGIPAYVSEDAGGYVCNHVYFAALHAIARAGLPTRCVFMHVPPENPAMPLAHQRDAVVTALDFLRESG